MTAQEIVRCIDLYEKMISAGYNIGYVDYLFYSFDDGATVNDAMFTHPGKVGL